MCMPLGPRWNGPAGRPAFTTIEEILEDSLETAQERYPDNNAAVEEIKEFIRDEKSHTFKWIINEIYSTNYKLGRIMVIPENLKEVKKYYNMVRKNPA